MVAHEKRNSAQLFCAVPTRNDLALSSLLFPAQPTQKLGYPNILILSNLQADWYNTVGLFSFSQNHQQIYLSLQYGKNTLDKSRLRK